MDGEITAAELHELLAEGADVEVVDIRDPGSFRRGHIPGSTNVPFDQLPSRVAEFDGAERIVTVCPHGKASVQAARLIGSYEGAADATVESLAAGLEGWEYDLDAAEATSADEGPETPF